MSKVIDLKFNRSYGSHALVVALLSDPSSLRIADVVAWVEVKDPNAQNLEAKEFEVFTKFPHPLALVDEKPGRYDLVMCDPIVGSRGDRTIRLATLNLKDNTDLSGITFARILMALQSALKESPVRSLSLQEDKWEVVTLELSWGPLPTREIYLIVPQWTASDWATFSIAFAKCSMDGVMERLTGNHGRAMSNLRKEMTLVHDLKGVITTKRAVNALEQAVRVEQLIGDVQRGVGERLAYEELRQIASSPHVLDCSYVRHKYGCCCGQVDAFNFVSAD